MKALTTRTTVAPTLGLVLRVVPAGHDVQAGAALAELVDGRDLLGHDYRMIRRGMGGGEHRQLLRLRDQPGCPQMTAGEGGLKLIQ